MNMRLRKEEGHVEEHLGHGDCRQHRRQAALPAAQPEGDPSEQQERHHGDSESRPSGSTHEMGQPRQADRRRSEGDSSPEASRAPVH